MNTATTFNGLHLDAPTSRLLRRLIAEVASMHLVDGDALGAHARALLSALPAEYIRKPRKVTPKQPTPEWWETKDKPDGN